MKSRSFLPVLLAAALMLVACGPKAGPTPAGTLPPIEQPTATTAPAATDTSEPAATDTTAPAGNPAAVDVPIQGFAFGQGELTVSVGTTVTWTNNDSAPHTVTADDGSWGSGRLNKGDTFSFTFDQAGTYTYHCKYHTAMAGVVTVTP